MSAKPIVTVDRTSTQVHVYTRQVSSWEDAQTELAYFPDGWIFRGQRNANWGLRCNLDRKNGLAEAIDAEVLVMREFERRAHLHLGASREPQDSVEWLALIQHHGGPTRLMDFTRSPLVAAFFALEGEGEEEDCAVWAMDEIACHSRAARRLAVVDSESAALRPQHDIEKAVAKQIGKRSLSRFVAPVRPSRLNARMSLQQGVFLVLGDPGSDLFANLQPVVEDEDPLRAVRVVFPRTSRGKALSALRRSNISRETLFPGLDGLAASLEHLLIGSDVMQDALQAEFRKPSGWPGEEPSP